MVVAKLRLQHLDPQIPPWYSNTLATHEHLRTQIFSQVTHFPPKMSCLFHLGLLTVSFPMDQAFKHMNWCLCFLPKLPYSSSWPLTMVQKCIQSIFKIPDRLLQWQPCLKVQSPKSLLRVLQNLNWIPLKKQTEKIYHILSTYNGIRYTLLFQKKGREYSVKTLDQSKIKNKLKKKCQTLYVHVRYQKTLQMYIQVYSALLTAKKNISLWSIYFPVSSFVTVAKASHCWFACVQSITYWSEDFFIFRTQPVRGHSTDMRAPTQLLRLHLTWIAGN